MKSKNNGYDPETYKAFRYEMDASESTAMAFANFFGWIQKKNNLDPDVRGRMEEIGMINPEGEIMIEEWNDPKEWYLIRMCYDGTIKRRYDRETKSIKYKITQRGKINR